MKIEEMKVGILGTGFGGTHAKIYSKIIGADSITVFGRNKDELKKIENELHVHVTTNIDDILSDKYINLVDVCLPITLHKKYVLDALKNGKDVFCETPITLNLEDAIDIKEAAKKYGKKVFVDLFIKFEPAYEYIYSTIQNNSLGKLKSLNLRRKTPPIWGSLEVTTITTNLMIHEFDFVTWLLGSPNKIMADGINSKEGQSNVSAILSYDDTIVEVQSSSMLPDYYPFTTAYEALFENGTIEYFEKCYKNREECYLHLFTNKGEEELDLSKKNCFEEAIKHVLNCCEKNIPTKLSIDDAIASLKIALQIKNIILNQ
jgi:UDP-N-acetylglucosamine 3-dehydrogenase